MHIHTSISIFIQKLKSQSKTIENFYKNQFSPFQSIKSLPADLVNLRKRIKNKQVSLMSHSQNRIWSIFKKFSTSFLQRSLYIYKTLVATPPKKQTCIP